MLSNSPGTGVVASNENSSLVSPAFKVTRAHNKYAELAGVARGVRNNYPYYSYRFDQSFECFSYEDTLYGFLTAKGLTVYPDWCFESPGLRNIAGIWSRWVDDIAEVVAKWGLSIYRTKANDWVHVFNRQSGLNIRQDFRLHISG